jgi:uncharacterized protein (UPF0335 family)
MVRSSFHEKVLSRGKTESATGASQSHDAFIVAFKNDPTIMADAVNGNLEVPSVTDAGPALSNGSSDKATVAKLSAQMKKLNDANSKYKNLLKLAKNRIEKQEEEISTLKHDHATLLERIYELEEKDVLSSTKDNIPILDVSHASPHDRNVASVHAVGTTSTPSADAQVVRILQRVECPVSENLAEIWALVEFQTTNDDGSNARRFKEWKRFDTESQLRDYVRRDTGEPIDFPSYSLSPEQSALIRHRADEQVAKITDEYRRFRVRSELSRKQAETQIRELQLSLAQKVTQRIENVSLNGSAGNSATGTEQLRQFSNQIERLKADMAIQESHWKESYEALFTENQALQSSGSEALLAAQWRQRYEQCAKEKEDLELRLIVLSPSAESNEYEAKYRDLKGEDSRISATLYFY